MFIDFLSYCQKLNFCEACYIRKNTGFIFQQYNLLPKLTIIENVELPLLYGGMDSVRRRERAMESLERVGLKEKWKNYPNNLQ